jgi:putative spermidine/putrescine transport system substrate-binding protein
MATNVDRRKFVKQLGMSILGLSGAAPLLQLRDAFGASAMPPEVKIAVYAGEQAQVMKEVWAPAIEAKYKTRVIIDDNTTSTKSLATMKAEKGAHTYSIMTIDQPLTTQARALDLLAPLDRSQMSNLTSIPEWGLLEGGHALGFSLSYVSLLYNAKYVKQISSWNDLLRPELKGKVIIPSMALLSAVYGLVLGGLTLQGQRLTAHSKLDLAKTTDMGFRFLEKLKPQLYSINSNDLPTFQKLASGEAWVVAPSYSKYIIPYRQQGIDLRVAFPREGAFLVYNIAAVVKGGPAEKAASGMLDLLLSTEFQAANAKRAGVGPMNSKVVLPAEDRQFVPAANELPAGIVPQSVLDFRYISDQFATWTKRFNAEIVG